jgi:hypothetical protein
MSRNIIYLDDGTVPHSVPVGRVLMHNHFPHDADTPSGTNDFREMGLGEDASPRQATTGQAG